MSGFVGIWSTDGQPVSKTTLEYLTRSLQFRGPDAMDVWTRGAVGLGHTLFRAGQAHLRERQPATLGDEVWLVGDIRIDARRQLMADLGGHQPTLPAEATDAELVLHAYRAWGERCPEHLLGDFAFAIWDAPRRQMFCARDQMGVKPFFYSTLPQLFLFGNTLECLRLHPEVPHDLNELAIADFLMFGCSFDVSTSAFAAIARLAPAHSLTVTGDGIRLRRYWTLPIDEPLFHTRQADYVDQFRELLTTAVQDRLRTDRVAIFMSGGLDSPLLAAEARVQLRGADAVSAFTYVYDHLIADDERRYAGMVAAHLGIPIRYWVLDEEVATQKSGPPAIWPPEPLPEYQRYEEDVDRYGEMAARAPVALYGEGPDNALHYEWRPYLGYLRRERRWGRMGMDIWRHLAAHRRIPLLSTVPAMIRNRRLEKQLKEQFPEWLNPDLVRRFDLRNRWKEWNEPIPSIHPVRPDGYRSMGWSLWARLFENLDSGWTRAALDVRHPYVDLRLLRFLLAVPALPWCRIKWLMRSATRDVLPDLVSGRKKSPLRGDPAFVRARGIVGVQTPEQAAVTARFVDTAQVPGGFTNSETMYTSAGRVQDLGRWLGMQGSNLASDVHRTDA